MSAQPSKCKASFRPIEVRLNPVESINPQAIVIRFTVSKLALSCPVPDGSSAVVHLELRISDQFHEVWTLVDPVSKESISVAIPQSEQIVVTQIATMMNLRSGTLSCFIDATPDQQSRLVYIRSKIFSHLNLAGGRYQPVGCILSSV
ncbi:MAG: hypothetical protein P1U42_01615 [Phycisphaerales bacterium]|nr:hypothetical protein [Phycisphaerales bacterium]